MKVRYDEQADAVYIKLKESKYRQSDEIKDGIIVDYDKKGKIIGIEILDASRYLLPSDLTSMQFEVYPLKKELRPKRAFH